MKLYGVGAGVYQTKAQKESHSDFSTISITPVVYDSETKTFAQALNGQTKLEFKPNSKPGIENILARFLTIVQEVTKLQKADEESSKKKIPIIFGFAEDFVSKFLITFQDLLNSLSGNKITFTRASVEKNLQCLKEYFKNQRLNLNDFVFDHRSVLIHEKAIAEVMGIKADSINSFTEAELTDDIVKNAVAKIVRGMHDIDFMATLQGETNRGSTFTVLGCSPDNIESLRLSKTISENPELRKRIVSAACKELSFTHPFVLKTIFDPFSPPFFDVVSRTIAIEAAKADPSLYGQMIGHVYIPDINTSSKPI